MIPVSSALGQTTRWQKLLAESITDPGELLTLLNLPQDELTLHLRAATAFKLRVPLSFVARMQKGDGSDPLLRQVLPLRDELIDTPGYHQDPLQEQQYNPLPGLLHKYTGRVLLTISSVCAINCRYCFRRHFPYAENRTSGEHRQNILNYISQDASIHEVILSGGDPLVVSDDYLTQLISDLACIPHLTTLRIHTRFPIMIPERITQTLLTAITATRLKTVVVLHCNHANEIDASVSDALTRLRQQGIMLLNQTVLLRGINDNCESLQSLNEKLFFCGVLPYYLHMPDRVQGTAHFAVDDNIALTLIAELRARSPGYLVPRLTREIPGEKSKFILA